MTLLPPPEREAFEREFKKLLPTDGDISDIARYAQTGQSNISRMYNPDCSDRQNPFFVSTVHLWAFDAMRAGLADDAIALVTRERLKWLPAPIVAIDPAASTSDLLEQFRQLMTAELEKLPLDVQLKEAQDVLRAAQKKVDEIQVAINVNRRRQNP